MQQKFRSLIMSQSKFVIMIWLYSGLITWGCTDTESSLEPEQDIPTEPGLFLYGSALSNFKLPDQLLAKVDSSEQARMIANGLFQINDQLAHINYQMDSTIASLEEVEFSFFDSSQHFLHWLPIHAESRDSSGFKWANESFKAKFYLRDMGPANALYCKYGGDCSYSYFVAQLAIDEVNQYYYLGGHGNIYDENFAYVLQSHDGTSGGLFSNHMQTKYSSWELTDGRLIFDISSLHQLNSFSKLKHWPTSWILELNSNGSGMLYNPNHCSDRYFWDKDGNGVHEKRTLYHNGHCGVHIIRW